MILDIELNDEPYCRAGIPEGAVSGFVSHLKIPDEPGTEGRDIVMLSVTGFIQRPEPTGLVQTAVHWGDIGQRLLAGDVVTITVDANGEADPHEVTAMLPEDEPVGAGSHTADWQREIVDLHDFFVGWFTGDVASMDRFETVLAPGFSLVAPDGVEHTRADLLDVIAAERGARSGLAIETAEYRLLDDDGRTVVVSYVEIQTTPATSTKRLATAVLQRDESAPNGVRWLRVHETWLSAE